MLSRLDNILVELDAFARGFTLQLARNGERMSGSLFDKYGGVETLTPLVKEFYKRIMVTPILARYFINTDMEVQFDTKSNSLLLLWENLQLFMRVWTCKQCMQTLIYLIVHLRMLLMFWKKR